MINNKQMRATVWHVVCAYVVLLVVVLLIYVFTLKPVLKVWSMHRLQTQNLAQAVNNRERDAVKFADETSNFQLSLKSMLEQGLISAGTDSSLISHQLQQQIKNNLSQHSAIVTQLNPSTATNADQLSDSRLDIRFRIRADKIDALLLGLAKAEPVMEIKMLTMRYAEPAVKHYQGQLDMGLALSVTYLDKLFIEQLQTAGIDTSSLGFTDDGQVAGQVSLEQLSESSKMPEPNLAGLFDADFRQRLRDPRPEQYRLTAITLSSNARVAIIADPLRDITHRLRVGEFLHDWRIETIEQQGVGLVKGDQMVLLELPEK